MDTASLHQRIAANRAALAERVRQAASRVGRDPLSVKIIAVTKYARLEWVRALVALGERELGEARPQQLVERATALDDLTDASQPIQWHLIGHLQRNKVRKVLPVTQLVHSIDSFKLLDDVDRIAGELGITARVLLEVNAADDKAKDGFEPDVLERDGGQLKSYQHVTVAGLMTMAALTESPEQARPAFVRLRLLRDRLRMRFDLTDLTELSMGMSGDFEVAIEEGSTMVRLGSALWEGLETDHA